MTTSDPSVNRAHARLRRPVYRPYKGLLAVQSAAILVAAIFLILGILGFTPGVTDHHEALRPLSPQSGALLFGTFQVSMLQNFIHLALGIAGLLLARSFAAARLYLLLGGLLCLGLWLYGLLIAPQSAANVAAFNDADNWLHFGFGVAMIVLGLTLAGTRVPTGARGEVLVPPEE